MPIHFKYIPYGLDSSAHSQAHSHSDRHQEDEESKCKPSHRRKLKTRREIFPTKKGKEGKQNVMLQFKRIKRVIYTYRHILPLGCHISEVNLTVGGLFG